VAAAGARAGGSQAIKKLPVASCQLPVTSLLLDFNRQLADEAMSWELETGTDNWKLTTGNWQLEAQGSPA
jgi:hypothetical protein